MEMIKALLKRIDELQAIIDRETQDADSGCDWSRSLIINAEAEKDDLQERIDALALFLRLNNL